ncbi:MAG TPA: histidine kinase [Micromonosporaceae bacterium]|nr:histidine kinase [Micromonosporaceae bacterium]
MAIPRAVKERATGVIWAGAWMWPLIPPLIASLRSQVPHAVWASVGLIAFMVLYLIVVTNAFDEDRRQRRGGLPRLDVALLLVLAALGMTLFIAYRDEPSGWWNIMLYIAVVGVALLPLRLAAAWTLGVIGVTVSWALVARGADAPDLGGLAQIVFGTLMAGALVQVIKQMQRYIRILRDTRAELAQNAVAQERLRFARDLHDLLGHTMSLIVVKAEVVRRLVEREPALAAEAAADIEAIGRRALTEVREAVNGYRAPEFPVELDSVRTALASAGISVRVRHDGPPVPPAASPVFGWAIREAATNVIRHSGAKACEVTVTVDATSATLEIRDTGRGHRAGPGSGDRAAPVGVGLVGLRERVTAAGGTLTTGNPSHGGFQVVVTMPATATPPCTAGADPSMWDVHGHAERSDREAAQPAVPPVPATASVGQPSDPDVPGAAVDSGTGPVAPPVDAPNVPAQPTPAAGLTVVAVQGKSS